MKKFLKQLCIVAFSLLLIGISVNMFLAPHNIAAGGVSGIGVLVEKALGINRALIVFVLNTVMLGLAYVFLGREVFVKITIGSFLLPVSLALVPETMVSQDRLFSVIIGSLIFAVGVAILYRNEASSGGTTIPPLIMKKYFRLDTSIGLFVTDGVVVIFNIFVFGIESFLFAIFSLLVTYIGMTYIETGLKRKKAVYITSDSHLPEIKQTLIERTGRDLKIFNITQASSGEKKEMLLLLVNDQNYPSILHIIDEIDKDSLIIAHNVAEIHGLGPN